MHSIGLTTKRRILIVDDNFDVANTTAELLRIMGNEVEVVHDGMAAVDTAFSMRPDVILLDIGLPRLDGYEVARKIRENAAIGQPILIALTGWGQEQESLAAAADCFDHHLVKPINLAQLTEAISR